MTFNTASWRPGVIARTDADIAADVMTKLEAENRLTPQALVDASRPEDAPMHQDFEWDDAIAGEEWRKQQARTYIGGLLYIPVDMPEITKPMKMFYKLDERREYNSVATIIRTEDGTEALRKQALRELSSFRDKYALILKLANATQTADELQQRLKLAKRDAAPQPRAAANA